MLGADSLFAEHVFEHLTPIQVRRFLLQNISLSFGKEQGQDALQDRKLVREI